MSRKKTTEEFIKEANDVHCNKYSYSKTIYGNNNKKKVTITCMEHGDFNQSPNSHLKGRGCPKCYGNNKKNNDDFINLANKIHGNKYNYSAINYINNRTKIIIICQTHGSFEQSPDAHLHDQGCPKCAGNQIKNNSEFISEANEKHNNKYDYSKIIYVSAHVKVIITCQKHGDFKQTANDHLKGNGCPKCQSTYKQNKWLDSLGIPDDNRHREVTIKVGKKIYRADGFDPETKTAYEFNGDSWHGNPNIFKQEDVNPKTKTTYGILYQNTLNKEITLKNANFNVISIWESDFDISVSHQA